MKLPPLLHVALQALTHLGAGEVQKPLEKMASRMSDEGKKKVAADLDEMSAALKANDSKAFGKAGAHLIGDFKL